MLAVVNETVKQPGIEDLKVKESFKMPTLWHDRKNGYPHIGKLLTTRVGDKHLDRGINRCDVCVNLAGLGQLLRYWIRHYSRSCWEGFVLF